MTTFPRWAQQLLDRHPGASAPTAQEPTPAWLLDELRQTPLWYIIREAQEVRRQHPFLVFDEIEREPDQWQEILDRMAVDVGRSPTAGGVSASFSKAQTGSCSHLG